MVVENAKSQVLIGYDMSKALPDAVKKRSYHLNVLLLVFADVLDVYALWILLCSPQ